MIEARTAPQRRREAPLASTEKSSEQNGKPRSPSPSGKRRRNRERQKQQTRRPVATNTDELDDIDDGELEAPLPPRRRKNKSGKKAAAIQSNSSAGLRLTGIGLFLMGGSSIAAHAQLPLLVRPILWVVGLAGMLMCLRLPQETKDCHFFI